MHDKIKAGELSANRWEETCDSEVVLAGDVIDSSTLAQQNFVIHIFRAHFAVCLFDVVPRDAAWRCALFACCAS